MRLVKLFSLSIFLFYTSISASEFTVSSFNCGALSDHYDYLRACSMQKVMQERYLADYKNMKLNDTIQKLALKILFTIDPQEKLEAQQSWEQNNYQEAYETLTSSPIETGSLNASWYQKASDIITFYKIRPIVINDEELKQLIYKHLASLVKNPNANFATLLLEGREIMAKRIFEEELKYDIICLQEADYLNASLFPKHYEVLLSESEHSKNGIAFNKNRFELIERIGIAFERAYMVRLLDKESNNTILVASGHITGCNPYKVVQDPYTGNADSAKGDHELQSVVNQFEEQEADLKLIAMDSNVTSFHPRLNIVKDAGYCLDYENSLEPTCTNPYLVLDTRIDWILIKGKNAIITNMPVMNVGLNNIQTNFSDHKPVAAKIQY
jgi:hypothetical protein